VPRERKHWDILEYQSTEEKEQLLQTFAQNLLEKSNVFHYAI
jgi:hypothetical protein